MVTSRRTQFARLNRTRPLSLTELRLYSRAARAVLAAVVWMISAGCTAAFATTSTTTQTSGAARVFSQSAYHIESQPYQRVQCTLTDSFTLPGLQAQEWTIYGPDAPDTDDQSNVFSTLDVTNHRCHVATWSELSPLGRTLLHASLVDDSTANCAELDTEATFTATLYRRILVPGPAPTPISPLSEDSRRLYTRNSETIDFDNRAFQTWLSATHLRREPGELDLDFGLRVFQYIRANYSYSYDIAQDRRASAICQVTASDCGGLSQLFVAAMRASGVPALALCGRLATSAADSDDHGNCHVKSEFFASGIGWVPVEISGATCDKLAPYSVYFGRMYGDFVTLSIDNDQELVAANNGVQNQRGLQGIRFFVTGTGDGSQTMTSTTSWSVRPLPLTTSGSQFADSRE